MPTTNDELQAIKEAVSSALITEFGIEGNGGHFLAVLSSIDAAVQMADADLPPFHIGARVRQNDSLKLVQGKLDTGTVTKRFESPSGELHTVLVRWDQDGPTADSEAVSPLYLREVTE